jgi:hypothetical protein
MKKKLEKLFESAIYSKNEKCLFSLIENRFMPFKTPQKNISFLENLLKNISQVNNVQIRFG